jgi:4-hydroxybenzoate polyprenyltransferase
MSGYSQFPLIVDLDNTLLLTDTLAEGIVDAVLRKPVSALLAGFQLFKGRAAFKATILDVSDPDYTLMPAREDLVEYLQAQKRAGRNIYLVTAAHQGIADRIAIRFSNLFDGAYGSSPDVNLKGSRKRDFLLQKFPDGFVYAGDSASDLKVWNASEGIVLAGPGKSIERQAKTSGKPLEAEFHNPINGFAAWRKAMRLHQWSKNILLFIPLFLSGQFTDLNAWILSGLAFLCLSLAASGTYILNDLVDLSADRAHRSKRFRPFASGTLSVLHGLLAAPIMIFGALSAAWFLSWPFFIGLAIYLMLTLSYSFKLKRIPLLDVFILGILFSLRIAMGAFVISAPPTVWLMTFSIFFFFSLSLAKRHVEIASTPAGTRVRGRGYYAEDAPLSLGLGLSSAMAAVLIMVLFLAENAFESKIYSMPECLWGVPVAIALWLFRIWLLAHRGELEDDPVSFAVRDTQSLALGAVLAISFVSAVYLGAL